MTSPTVSRPAPALAPARQRIEFRTGDEAVGLAARAVGFDPASLAPAPAAAEVALFHGAALGGVRVVAAVSSQGLAASTEQLAVASSSRVPMVLAVAARALAGPIDGGCDHSVLYRALDCGWIVLAARDPQAVHDFCLAAVRIGEHADVRLPVLVAYDGHVTSDEKRRVLVVEDAEALRAFLGTRPPMPSPLDLAHPATFGAPPDEADFVESRLAVTRAMNAARDVIPAVFAELAALTGRAYPVVEAYAMDEAEVAVVLAGSAAEAAKEAVDVWRDQGRKVGALSPNVLRPFPSGEFRALLAGVKGATVGDRAECHGVEGGTLALEIRAALHQGPAGGTCVLARIYGLGGAPFGAADAERLLDQALVAASTGLAQESFAWHGAADAEPEKARPALPPVRAGDVPHGMAKVRRNDVTGRLEVELAPLWRMTSVPSRIAPGHGACPGCGALPTLHQVGKALDGDLVVLFQSGCAIAVTSAHAGTAHRVNCIHCPAGHGAATLSGLVEAWRERVRRGELPASANPTFVMVTGDGGMEADLSEVIAAAHRNARLMILEYDNQGRMSTGGQATQASALATHLADTAQVIAACHVPYVFTACEGFPEDLMRKAAKAQWYARNEGLAYGRILSFCPLDWQAAADAAQPVLQAAIDSCLFPLYEVERGHTTITFDPDALGRRKPVSAWSRLLGKTAHLADPANAAAAGAIQAETDRRWARLKAMHGHPAL